MKKNFTCYLLLICFGSVFSVEASADQLLTEKFAAAPFHAINVSGPISVQVNSGQAKQSLQLIGDKNSLCHVYAAVKNDTLYLGIQPNFYPNTNSQLMAKVNSGPLNALRYAGSGDVTIVNVTGPMNIGAYGSGTVNMTGKNIDLRNITVTGSNNVNIIGINSDLINVQDGSSGKVNLGGTMVLQNLVYSGSGPLSIYWINSSGLKVVGSGKGRIFLAGIAGLFDATISDHVYLDAKYLHTNRAFVNTRDLARADVWAKCSLSSLASGSSNIFYYNDPLSVVGSYMDPPGAVLRMTGIDQDHIPIPPKPC